MEKRKIFELIRDLNRPLKQHEKELNSLKKIEKTFPEKDEKTFPKKDERPFPIKNEMFLPRKDERPSPKKDMRPFPRKDERPFPKKDEKTEASRITSNELAIKRIKDYESKIQKVQKGEKPEKREKQEFKNTKYLRAKFKYTQQELESHYKTIVKSKKIKGFYKRKKFLTRYNFICKQERTRKRKEIAVKLTARGNNLKPTPRGNYRGRNFDPNFHKKLNPYFHKKLKRSRRYKDPRKIIKKSSVLRYILSLIKQIRVVKLNIKIFKPQLKIATQNYKKVIKLKKSKTKIAKSARVYRIALHRFYLRVALKKYNRLKQHLKNLKEEFKSKKDSALIPEKFDRFNNFDFKKFHRLNKLNNFHESNRAKCIKHPPTPEIIQGKLRVLFTKRNIFLTLSNKKGGLKTSISSGFMKVKGKKRHSLHIVKATGRLILKQILKHKITKLAYESQGKTFNKKKKTILKIFKKNFTFHFLRVNKPTPRSHNGCRPKKIRRK